MHVNIMTIQAIDREHLQHDSAHVSATCLQTYLHPYLQMYLQRIYKRIYNWFYKPKYKQAPDSCIPWNELTCSHLSNDEECMTGNAYSLNMP